MRREIKIYIFLLLLSIFKVANVEASQQFSNRYLTYNILKNIFGSQAHHILKTKVLDEYATFGGGCSLMEKNIIKVNENKDKNISSIHFCDHGLSESKVAPYSQSAIRRNALIMSACESLTSSDITFNHLIKKTLIFPSIRDKAEQIVLFFYPLMKNPSSFLNNIFHLLLKGEHSKFNTIFDDLGIRDEMKPLRELTYLLCISEKWQKL